MKTLCRFIGIFFLALPLAAQSKPAADLIINHAKIWTVDASRPEAQAVAVLGDRIVAVGSNDEVNQWRGPTTRAIDAGGKLLLPGFNSSLSYRGKSDTTDYFAARTNNLFRHII